VISCACSPATIGIREMDGRTFGGFPRCLSRGVSRKNAFAFAASLIVPTQ